MVSTPQQKGYVWGTRRIPVLTSCHADQLPTSTHFAPPVAYEFRLAYTSNMYDRSCMVARLARHLNYPITAKRSVHKCAQVCTLLWHEEGQLAVGREGGRFSCAPTIMFAMTWVVPFPGEGGGGG